PISSLSNTSLQIPTNTSSIGVRAPSLSFSPSSLTSSISSSLFLSIFPLTLLGISSITTISPGTMYSGTLSFIYLCNSSLPTFSSPISTYPTSFFSPLPSSFTTTALSLTLSCPLSTSSTSSSSIRYPLTFTCRSFLPTSSISPSPTYFPLSPVRYSLPPSSPLNQSGTYFSPVSLPFPMYPLPTPAPPINISPSTPTPTTSISSSTMYTFTFPIPLPILTLSFLSSHSHIVAHTVVSVGPYAFINLLPLPHFFSNSFSLASPATTSTSTSIFSSSPLIALITVGGNVTVVIACSFSNCTKPLPGSISSHLPKHSLPPPTSTVNISLTDASKLIDAYCSTRLPSPIPNPSICPLTRLHKLPCSIITPFGSPVVPDVYITYARFLLSLLLPTPSTLSSAISAHSRSMHTTSAPISSAISSTLSFRCPCVITTFTPASLIMYSSLFFGYPASIGRYAPPAFSTPTIPTICSIPLSTLTPTISSAPTPFFIKYLASWFPLPSSSS